MVPILTQVTVSVPWVVLWVQRRVRLTRERPKLSFRELIKGADICWTRIDTYVSHCNIVRFLPKAKITSLFHLEGVSVIPFFGRTIFKKMGHHSVRYIINNIFYVHGGRDFKIWLACAKREIVINGLMVIRSPSFFLRGFLSGMYVTYKGETRASWSPSLVGKTWWSRTIPTRRSLYHGWTVYVKLMNLGPSRPK